MRIQLQDDRQGGCRPTPGPFSAVIALDGDLPGCGCGGQCADDSSSGNGTEEPGLGEPTLTLTVRERLRDTYDFTGTPQLSWVTRASGLAISYIERRERNDATGQTWVTAKATLGWDEEGPAPTETAVVWDSDGHRWDVTSVQPFPGRLELLMQRIDDAE